MNENTTITIMICNNGFFLESGGGRQLFATRESLIAWLGANLPAFPQVDPRLAELKKDEADG